MPFLGMVYLICSLTHLLSLFLPSLYFKLKIKHWAIILFILLNLWYTITGGPSNDFLVLFPYSILSLISNIILISTIDQYSYVFDVCVCICKLL